MIDSSSSPLADGNWSSWSILVDSAITYGDQDESTTPLQAIQRVFPNAGFFTISPTSRLCTKSHEEPELVLAELELEPLVMEELLVGYLKLSGQQDPASTELREQHEKVEAAQV